MSALIDKQAALKIASMDSEIYIGINCLPSIQPDDSCDGCQYEDADDGVIVPCGFCKRNHPDNYERRTDETDRR